MEQNTLTKDKNMAGLKKADCISIESAIEQLHVVRNTLRTYMNVLGVVSYKFSLDRKSYISKLDFERVKALIDENRS